jgi:hypothetical protein
MVASPGGVYSSSESGMISNVERGERAEEMKPSVATMQKSWAMVDLRKIRPVAAEERVGVRKGILANFRAPRSKENFKFTLGPKT